MTLRRCKSCGEEVEVYRRFNLDVPDFCPACRDIDSLEDIEDEEEVA